MVSSTINAFAVYLSEGRSRACFLDLTIQPFITSHPKPHPSLKATSDYTSDLVKPLSPVIPYRLLHLPDENLQA